MLSALYLVFCVVVVGAVIGLMLIRPFWVMFTQRPDDVLRIKAEYQGLNGRLGPNCEVLSATRNGFAFGGRSRPPSRVYDVKIKKPNGETVQKNIQVEASLFGSGSVYEMGRLRPD